MSQLRTHVEATQASVFYRAVSRERDGTMMLGERYLSKRIVKPPTMNFSGIRPDSNSKAVRNRW